MLCDFARCIPYLNSLIILTLNSDSIMRRNPTIRSLAFVPSRPPSPSGLVKVIEALQRHRNLKSLTMTSMSGIEGMGPEEGEALLNLVQSKECCLTELKISATDLHRVIPQIMTLSTSLEFLFIGEITENTRDILHNVDNLSNNISTLYLYAVNFSFFSNSFIERKLGNMIKNNKTLKELALNFPISECGVNDILHSLSINTTLEILRLRKWYFELLSEHERKAIDPRVKFEFVLY